MPDRHTTYRITLTPATEAALLQLKECGENKQLLSRCALWCSSGALEAIIVLRKQRYPYQVGQAGEWGECILPGVSRRLRGPRQTLTYLHRIVPQQRGLRAMLPTLSSQICPNPEFGSRQMPMLLSVRLSSAEPPRNDRASATATSARVAMARVSLRIRVRRIAGLQN